MGMRLGWKFKPFRREKLWQEHSTALPLPNTPI